MTSLLSVRDLSISFSGDDGKVTALDKVSFDIPAGKTVCLVGESGCGKSVTAKALLRILDHHASIDQGEMLYHRADGDVMDLVQGSATSKAIKSVQGNEISMIYQEPMTALSPLYTIGNQITEVLHWHGSYSKDEARARAIEVLGQVGLPNPEKRFDAYTFEMSGGMRQRAMIAMALVSNPRLLIADEPTTALDVTTQAIILDLMRDLQKQREMSMLFITHDLGVVADIADEVVIMYLGNVVERGTVDEILTNPQHPYTRGLLASLPGRQRGKLHTIQGTVPSLFDRPTGCAFQARCAQALPQCGVERPQLVDQPNGHGLRCFNPITEQTNDHTAVAEAPRQIDRKGQPILRLRNVAKHFPVRGGLFNRVETHVKALNGVSLDLWQGETLGLVGESGCGKSTLGQTIMGLHSPSAGQITFAPYGTPTDLAGLSDKALRPHWKDLRMIFQDPNSSLNPRMTVFDIVAEVLRMGDDLTEKSAIEARVREIMTQVGFDPSFLKRYPHAFSGGQRQRIGIARALAPHPKLVIADESVSALDVSVQAQILNLMKELQDELGLTYIFISHDLSVVAHVSDRVAVMYAGRIVELGETAQVFDHPRHPYTEALLGAILEPTPRSQRDDDKLRLDGNVPDPLNLPPGCPFAPRCRYATEICEQKDPALTEMADGRALACHFEDVVQGAAVAVNQA